MKLEFDANEFEEVYMQEIEINLSTGCTLPAGQVIAEQSQDVKEHLTLQFVT